MKFSHIVRDLFNIPIHVRFNNDWEVKTVIDIDKCIILHNNALEHFNAIKEMDPKVRKTNECYHRFERLKNECIDKLCVELCKGTGKGDDLLVMTIIIKSLFNKRCFFNPKLSPNYRTLALRYYTALRNSRETYDSLITAQSVVDSTIISTPEYRARLIVHRIVDSHDVIHALSGGPELPVDNTSIDMFEADMGKDDGEA